MFDLAYNGSLAWSFEDVLVHGGYFYRLDFTLKLLLLYQKLFLMACQFFIAEYKLNMQNQQVDLMTVVVAVVVVVVVVVVDGMVVMTEEVEGMMTGAEGKLKYSFLL